MSGEAKWTVMVYMAGHNDLSHAADKDLSEMRRIGSSPDVDLVVQIDKAGARGARRFRVEKGGRGERPVPLGPTDSGDPDVLLAFVDWTLKSYRAERYALVLWSHGTGWQPSETDAKGASAGHAHDRGEPSTSSPSPTRSSFLRPRPADGSGTGDMAAICPDDRSGHSLDTVELGLALGGVQARLGSPLELLGMDACMMSNLEVAFQARPFSRTMVASEMPEPVLGWPYADVLRHLVDDPDIEAADLAAHIVASYINSYTRGSRGPDVTLSALDLTRIVDVVGPVDRLAQALISSLPSQRDQVKTAHSRTARFYRESLCDLAQFCRRLDETVTDAGVRSAARKVRESLKPGVDRPVISSGRKGSRAAGCGGISVYLPVRKPAFRDYWRLEFNRASDAWFNFLRAYSG